MNLCESCGRVYHAVRDTALRFCAWCVMQTPSFPQSLLSALATQNPPNTRPTTFEERTRLRTARFKVAMGSCTDFPGEVSLPDRRVPGQAWYEARAILADFYIELAVPDENPVGQQNDEEAGQ